MRFRSKLTLRSDVFDFSELIQSLVQITRIELGDKPVMLSCSIPDGIPRLKGDVTRVGQILSNLLSNAGKYTERGEIVVSVSGASEAGDPNIYGLRIAIRDTGFGIPSENLQRIFDPFTRFHEFYEGKVYKGVGLGLHIVQTLVKLMNGDILVSSEVGKGSEFVVTLKFERAS